MACWGASVSCSASPDTPPGSWRSSPRRATSPTARSRPRPRPWPWPVRRCSASRWSGMGGSSSACSSPRPAWRGSRRRRWAGHCSPPRGPASRSCSPSTSRTESPPLAAPIAAPVGAPVEEPALRDELAGLGRFAEPSLVVLLALSDGPKHGYAIMTEARSVTREPLGPGTPYATLSRLEARGLIEGLPAEDRRRPYRLTADGAAVLRAHLEGIDGIVREGLARLRRSEGSPPTTS